MPPGAHVSPGRGGAFELVHQGAPLGTIDYFLGPLDPLSAGNVSAFPALEGAVHAGAPVLQITGFHSAHEHTIKGIGSALLGQLVATAETHGCDHIVVLMGINHPVYEAFGFRLVEPILQTWWMPTSDLKSRVGQRPVRAGIPSATRPRFREAPL